jgi:hypothetical protein
VMKILVVMMMMFEVFHLLLIIQLLVDIMNI